MAGQFTRLVPIPDGRPEGVPDKAVHGSGHRDSAENFSSPLLLPKEVAAILRCSVQAVYWWAETGRLPHFRLGRLVRFDAADIHSYLRAQHRRAGR